jgi:hypothetical protein
MASDMKHLINKKSYKCFVLLPNHKQLNRYQAGFIIIQKIVNSNTIIKIQYGKSYNTNLTLVEAKQKLAQTITYARVKNTKERMDYLITSLDQEIKGVTNVKRDIYNIRNESELIRQYMGVQHYFKTIKTDNNINPYLLNFNKGIVLLEGDITKLRLDYGAIPTYVIPTLFAIDLVLHNKSLNIIDILNEE